MFGHTYNPNYFINPPAYTYLLHAAFALGFGGRDGVSEAFAADPGDVFAVARALSARARRGRRRPAGVGGRAAVRPPRRRSSPRRCWPSPSCRSTTPTSRSTTSRRSRRVCLALVGVAGVFARGRARRLRARRRRARARLRDQVHRRASCCCRCWRRPWPAPGQPTPRRVGGLVLAGVLALAFFLTANPYALLDFDAFRDGPQRAVGGVERRRRQARPDRRQRDPLLPRDADLGPRLAARAGGARRRGGAGRRATGAARSCSCPRSLVFLAVHGLAGPLLRALAAARLPAAVPARRLRRGAARDLGARARRAGRAPPGPRPLAGVLLCAQGLVFAIHNDVVLARADTRRLARDWMVENVPAGHEGRDRAGRPRRVGERHRPRAARHRQRRALEQVADLALAPKPRRHAAQARGRAGRQARGLRAHAVPRARRASTSAAATARCSPARPSSAARWPSRRRSRRRCATTPRCAAAAASSSPRRQPVKTFSFDFSFNSYPLSFERPGPEIVIYRLTGGACRGR